MGKPSVPQPPTTADLDEHGPAACLAALREEFAEAHKRWDQYAGWIEGTTLGVVRYRHGGDGTFVRAEAGDLVLVKRAPRPWYTSGLHANDVAYMPRIGWNVGIMLGGVDDVE